MMNKHTEPDSTADREIITSRVLNAPRELVFEVWTDPKHIVHWWGPDGFSCTISEMEVKPGGEWRFIMHGPDGRDYHNKIIFTEVIKPERLVYRHAGEKETSHISFHVTVTFEAMENKTRLTLIAVFPTAEEREQAIKERRAVEGAEQTIARLDQYLTKLILKNNKT